MSRDKQTGDRQTNRPGPRGNLPEVGDRKMSYHRGDMWGVGSRKGLVLVIYTSLVVMRYSEI